MNLKPTEKTNSSRPGRGRKALKILGIILLALVAAVLIFLFGCTSHRQAAGKEAGQQEGLYVDGTQLKQADGTPVVLRGINHAHTWYPDQDRTAFDAIAATGANCIRVVLADGRQWDADDAETVAQLMAMAKERDMIIILEVHDGTGDDSVETLQEITDYWIGLADVLKGSEDYCIVNIANEWVGSWVTGTWKDGYTGVIPQLREAGIENVLLVDSPGWGQYGRAIRKYGMEVYDSDPDHNTMFSVHMYGLSGGAKWLIRYNLEGARDQNLCVCVGEFGYKHSDGDVKEDYLMEYCAEQGIGTLAWSWKGNSGGVEYLDLSNDWEGKDLTPDWGEKVVNGPYGIRNTAEPLHL